MLTANARYDENKSHLFTKSVLPLQSAHVSLPNVSWFVLFDYLLISSLQNLIGYSFGYIHTDRDMTSSITKPRVLGEFATQFATGRQLKTHV